jgi:hypothetical protein
MKKIIENNLPPGHENDDLIPPLYEPTQREFNFTLAEYLEANKTNILNYFNNKFGECMEICIEQLTDKIVIDLYINKESI